MIKYFYKKELAKIHEFEKTLPDILFPSDTIKNINKNMIIIECFEKVFGVKQQDTDISLIEVFNDIENKEKNDLTLLLFKYNITVNDIVKDKYDREHFIEELIIKYDLELIIRYINDINDVLGFEQISLNNHINIEMIIQAIANKIEIPYNGKYEKDDILEYIISVSLSDKLQLEVMNGYIKKTS